METSKQSHGQFHRLREIPEEGMVTLILVNHDMNLNRIEDAKYFHTFFENLHAPWSNTPENFPYILAKM